MSIKTVTMAQWREIFSTIITIRHQESSFLFVIIEDNWEIITPLPHPMEVTGKPGKTTDVALATAAVLMVCESSALLARCTMATSASKSDSTL